MASNARAGFVLFAFVAVGGGVAAYYREWGSDAPEVADAGEASDASVDGQVKVAKGKGPPQKKPVAKGKPRVAGHTTRVTSGAHAAAGAHSSGAHHAPGVAGNDPHGSQAASSAHHPHHVSPSGSSYESVLDSNNQHINVGGSQESDLTDAQLSGPLRDGTFISECGAPDDMGVTVKVAIRNGHAVGVSVSTHPYSAEVAGCVDHHVRGLTWPASSKMDSFVTTY